MNSAVRLLATMMLLLPSVPSAQWIEFEDLGWGFTINFPHAPQSEALDYTTYYGATVPAQRFNTSGADGEYSVTVVYFSGAPTDSHTAIAYATQAVADRGDVTYNAFDNLDGIPGQMISVTEPDGRRTQASIYFVDQRLYIAQGSVPASGPSPSRFAQSIVIIGPDGEQIVLDEDPPNVGDE